MLPVTDDSDVATAMNFSLRNIRRLLTATGPARRIPAVKLGRTWPPPRSSFAAYLVADENDPTPGQD
jgi:hypothetical protein